MAVNVALYTPKATLWAMTERPRTGLSTGAGQFTVGPSSLTRNGDLIEIELDEVTAPMPKRLKGRVSFRLDPMFSARYPLEARGRHHWRPIAPHMRVSVAFDKPDISWEGHGYFDMNEGHEPLAKGFHRWDWSRARRGRETVILYSAEMPDIKHRHPSDAARLFGNVSRCGDDPVQSPRQDLGLIYRDDGSISMFDVPPRCDLPRGFWGVKRSTAADPGSRPRVRRALVDSPFYVRSMITTVLGGQPLVAMHESLDLRRFSSPIVKSMLPVRMPRGWWFG